MRFGWNNEGLSGLAVMMWEEGGIFGKGRGILSFLNPDSMGFKGGWSFGRDMQAAFTGKDTVIFASGLEYAAFCRHNDSWWPCKPDFVTADFTGRFLSGGRRMRFPSSGWGWYVSVLLLDTQPF